jgi:hypothetical protein
MIRSLNLADAKLAVAEMLAHPQDDFRANFSNWAEEQGIDLG